MNIRIVDYLTLDSRRREEAKNLLKDNIFSHGNELSEDESTSTVADNIDWSYKQLEEKAKLKNNPYRSIVVLKDGVPVGTTFGHILGSNEITIHNLDGRNHLQLDFTAVKDVEVNLFFISRYRRTTGSELGLRMFNWGRKFGCKEVSFLEPSEGSKRGINWMIRNGWIERKGKFEYAFRKLPKTSLIKSKPTPPVRIGVKGILPKIVRAKVALRKRPLGKR